MFKQLRNRNEDGNALILVISAIFLIGVLVITMVVGAIGGTTAAAATRANSQAVAAAQGGIDDATVKMRAGACPEVGVKTTLSAGSDTLFAYTITELSVDGGGCSTGALKSGKTIRLVVEGEASDFGVSTSRKADQTRNIAQLERVFESEVVKTFTAAVMAGAKLAPDNGSIISTSSVDSEPADLISHGYWGCYGGTSSTEGDSYALGGIKVDNPCVIGRDLYARGTVDANYLEVRGDLYVVGDVKIHNTLKVSGTTYIIGNLELAGGDFKKSVYVTGDVTYSTAQKFADNLYVGGQFFPNYASTTFGGDVYLSDATRLTNPNFHSGLGAGKSIHVAHSKDVVGNEWFRTSHNSVGVLWDSAAVSAQLSANEKPVPDALIPDKEEEVGINFPFITKNDELFTGANVISSGSFLASVGGSRSGSKCVVNNTGTHKFAFNTKTVIDLSDCDFEWHNGHIEIDMYSDVYIIARRFDSSTAGNGSLTVRGPRVTGKLPVFGIVVPADDGQTQCDATTSGHSGGPYQLFFTNVKFNQMDTINGITNSEPSVQLFLYSGKKVRLGTSATPLYGQVYGCEVSAYSNQNIRFSVPGSKDNNEFNFVTRSVRDVTK
ncbi:hypothetical protein ACFSYH_03585 [Populibacterium corticicola]|uniref:Flp pilus-assembly TadG-like N-terminal domain-containing protein n=1 Tax=Populibacterium corticicola TaxID=1812826 RepID=A0ABW5XD21_9MICO